MRKVLYILGSLADTDVDWIVAAGQVQPLSSQDVLIHEGKSLDALFIVLEGTLAVSVSAQPGKVLSQVGPGEVLGEISMLDSRPPLATVSATAPSQVLRIPRSRLAEKLETDNAFGSRFYRALAVFLAHRMRERTEKLAPGKSKLDEDVESDDEIDPELLDLVSLAGKRFEWILSRLKGRG